MSYSSTNATAFVVLFFIHGVGQRELVKLEGELSRVCFVGLDLHTLGPGVPWYIPE